MSDQSAAPAQKSAPWGIIIFSLVLAVGLIAGLLWWKNRKFLSQPVIDASKPNSTVKDTTVKPGGDLQFKK